MARAHLDKRPGDVAAMFDKVVPRYDLLNDVLSLGQDRWWRKVVAKAVGARGRARWSSTSRRAPAGDAYEYLTKSIPDWPDRGNSPGR